SKNVTRKDSIFLNSDHFAVLFCDIFELVWKEARTIGARTQGFNLIVRLPTCPAIELLSFHLLFRRSVHAFFEMIPPASRNFLDVCKSSSLRLPPQLRRNAKPASSETMRTGDSSFSQIRTITSDSTSANLTIFANVRERIRVKHKLDRLRKLAEDPHYNLKKMIFRWCYRYPWVREELDWKSHVPVSSEQKISRLCTGCGYRRTGGQKLWFRRKYDPDLYDCFSCFLGTDSVQALPRGCEDIRTIAELRVRKEELDAQGFTSKSPSGDTANDSKESEP
ncbi:hypothetical protein D6D01_07988, partial [Aureobasidium pullulans]